MNYDVFLQRNSVYIGMEDVSVTYRNEETTVNVTLEEAKKIVATAAEKFANSEQVQRLAGKSTYYPTQWELPCRAIVAPHGAVTFHITNYSDLYKANKLGAVDISFSSNTEENIKAVSKLTA